MGILDSPVIAAERLVVVAVLSAAVAASIGMTLLIAGIRRGRGQRATQPRSPSLP